MPDIIYINLIYAIVHLPVYWSVVYMHVPSRICIMLSVVYNLLAKAHRTVKNSLCHTPENM